MFAGFRKSSEKRKARRKKRLICLAVILAFPLPLAALRAAERKKAAIFAFLRNKKALLDKFGRLLPGQCGFNRDCFYVAEEPFIGTVKIAGV